MRIGRQGTILAVQGGIGVVHRASLQDEIFIWRDSAGVGCEKESDCKTEE